MVVDNKYLYSDQKKDIFALIFLNCSSIFGKRILNFKKRIFSDVTFWEKYLINK